MNIERFGHVWLLVPAMTLALALPRAASAQEPPSNSPAKPAPPEAAAPQAAPEEPQPEEPQPDQPPQEPGEPIKVDPAGLTRLSKEHNVWLDAKRKLVVVDGKVCLRRGPLEMFACPRGTKEHEAIVSIGSPAFIVHAGLLAVGAKVGSPVKFRPEYTPASGTVIDVWVLWKDSAGEKHKVRAQEWIKNDRTGKPMAFDWVFAGSGFWVDEDTGERHYHADGGDFICVSNFPTAMLDLPVESSQANDALLYSAFTERIPPIGTEVRLVLAPRIPRPSEGSSDSSSDGESLAPGNADPGNADPGNAAPGNAAPGNETDTAPGNRRPDASAPKTDGTAPRPSR